jgi:hypothetical protein
LKSRSEIVGLPNGCVTGAGARVDSVWEQKELEARKMLENAAESHTSGAPNQDSGQSFFPKGHACPENTVLGGIVIIF